MSLEAFLVHDGVLGNKCGGGGGGCFSKVPESCLCLPCLLKISIILKLSVIIAKLSGL